MDVQPYHGALALEPVVASAAVGSLRRQACPYSLGDGGPVPCSPFAEGDLSSLALWRRGKAWLTISPRPSSALKGRHTADRNKGFLFGANLTASAECSPSAAHVSPSTFGREQGEGKGAAAPPSAYEPHPNLR